jgi:hypothetical protein
MPGFLGAADIPAILADLAGADGAVEVTFGATTVTGLFDRAAVQFFDGEMPTTIVDGEAVHIQADSLPGLEHGSTVTVAEPGTAGDAYTVIRVLCYGDGAMQRIALARNA